MSNSDHVSRTLLLSRRVNGTLLVSRGSGENMDFSAQEVSSGISQIKAFDINNLPDGRPYDYASEGTLIGWGLRNSVGVAEHPVTGGIYSVENSADQIKRSGTDIHQDDPGEEMNYHGFLNRTDELHGKNYGYPDCFALWGTDIPDKGKLTVGDQFTLDPNSDLNDTTCADEYVSPRLTFQAHTAPLDMLFTPDGAEAYITFHGSCKSSFEQCRHLSYANSIPREPGRARRLQALARQVLQRRARRALRQHHLDRGHPQQRRLERLSRQLLPAGRRRAGQPGPAVDELGLDRRDLRAAEGRDDGAGS